ncbi:hypothetical protein V1281_004716 [Nitrobacteraceae bacterium AZCC 2161]
MTISKRKLLTNVSLSKSLLAAIGRVAALWAQLEYVIDSKINSILQLPGAPKIDPKLMVPFNQRLELLDQLCKQFLTDADNRDHAGRIIANLKQLAVQRNLIVHGSIANSKQRHKGQIVYLFRRVRWDAPTARIVERRSFTVSGVETFAATISDQIPSALLIEVFFCDVKNAPLGKVER